MLLSKIAKNYLHYVTVSNTPVNVFFPHLSLKDRMGNTVTAAEAVADNLIHPVGKAKGVQHHHQGNYKEGVPPPECPMHQKVQPPPTSGGECPVGYGNNDINPLNMVGTTELIQS